MLLRQDGLRRRDVAALRRELERQGDPALAALARRRILAYLRRDFHPNDVDDLAFARERLAQVGLAGAG
jgi:hypothetical protein